MADISAVQTLLFSGIVTPSAARWSLPGLDCCRRLGVVSWQQGRHVSALPLKIEKDPPSTSDLQISEVAELPQPVRSL